MYSGTEIVAALILSYLVMVIGNRMFGEVKRKKGGQFVIKSEIQGSEGKIVTYNIKIFETHWYVSNSETKWHLDDKYKRTPIWFSAEDGYPSLYIWKTAIFYESKANRKKRNEIKNK